MDGIMWHEQTETVHSLQLANRAGNNDSGMGAGLRGGVENALNIAADQSALANSHNIDKGSSNHPFCCLIFL